MMEQATSLLLKAQNADGGWGASEGRQSNTEATSLAVLALESIGKSFAIEYVRRGVAWLAGMQRRDGSWPLAAGLTEPSWSTAYAVFTLSNFATYRRAARRGGEWLLAHEGSALPFLASLLIRFSLIKKASELDHNLVGWPWTAGTFSWVEPTSYALMALKKLKFDLAGKRLEERIRQGEVMIYDRMCEGGGWNYGNSKVMGETLWPYPDITALALIALQDRPEDEANRMSLRALEKMLKEVNSGLALAWSIICFSLYGRETGPWRRLLVKNFDETKFLGETKSLALSVLALGGGANFFRV